jgi:hypothetical protein
MYLKEDEMGEACSTYANDEKCIQYLVRIPVVETPLERPWKNYIKMELKEIWFENMKFIYVLQVSVQSSTVMNFRVT